MREVPARVAALAMALLAWASVASANLVENDQNTSTGFTVSSTDLLNGLVGTVNDINNIRAEEGVSIQSLVPLTNGLFGIPSVGGDSANVVSIHNGTVITYMLPLAASTAGYAISGINIYAGWRDAGRDAIGCTVSYSLLNSPTVFQPLKTINYNPAGMTPSDTAVFLADNVGDVLMRGVVGFQFSFPTTENGYVGYREFDVFGTQETPEPTTLLLALLGLAGLRRHVRKHRKA